MADSHGEEFRVERTTPQGTQEHGVARGHEDRDVKIGALMNWMIGLVVMMVVVFASMWGLFAALASYENRLDVMPSPMFEARAPIPASMPRLLPNPAQQPGDPHTPWEVGQAERDRQNAENVKIGLASEVDMEKSEAMEPRTPSDETTIAEDGKYAPTLPANAETMIAADQPVTAPATNAATGEALANGVLPESPGLDTKPSYSSGGLRVEGKRR